MIQEQYEAYSKLELPPVSLDLDQLNWVQYNPRKDIKRWGASITSIDGGMSGVPDLDSLVEYNKLNGTQFYEDQFRTFTPQGKAFEFMQERFDIGRSHVIRLGSGGFFPFHRDLGQNTFRIVYCMRNCNPNNFIWLQGNQCLPLQDGQWYYINTKQAHATFSFFGCEFAVFNVLNTDRSHRALRGCLEIR